MLQNPFVSIPNRSNSECFKSITQYILAINPHFSQVFRRGILLLAFVLIQLARLKNNLATEPNFAVQPRATQYSQLKSSQPSVKPDTTTSRSDEFLQHRDAKMLRKIRLFSTSLSCGSAVKTSFQGKLIKQLFHLRWRSRLNSRTFLVAWPKREG